MGKYAVTASAASESAESNTPNRTWTCAETVEGLDDVFTGYSFSGEADWNEDGINLAQPDNAEMSVKFKLPEHITDKAEQLFLLIAMNWLSESDDCKFETMINNEVVDSQPIRLSADDDAQVVYHVPIAACQLVP